jgi:hypothetical protein
LQPLSKCFKNIFAILTIVTACWNVVITPINVSKIFLQCSSEITNKNNTGAQVSNLLVGLQSYCHVPLSLLSKLLMLADTCSWPSMSSFRCLILIQASGVLFYGENNEYMCFYHCVTTPHIMWEWGRDRSLTLSHRMINSFSLRSSGLSRI